MLMNRIIGAFTFRREVYAEVEKDQGFTTTAWILVLVVQFLNQLGTVQGNLVDRAIGGVIGAIVSTLGFAVAAFIIQWVGRTVFKAQVDFNEMVRTLGLANVWGVVGLIGIVGVLSPALACVLAPAMLLAAILALIAFFVAAKEALDLEWVPTIVTVIIGWLVMMIITAFVGGTILAMLGIGGAVLGGLPG